MEQLQIRMLGEFTLQAGERQISSEDSRSKKVWLLLACLICRRERTVSQSELISLIWGGEPASDRPENVLKVTLHRARALLDKLWPGAGHELILRRGDGYAWNQEIPMAVDTQRFEALCGSAALEDRLEAIGLYRGVFLDKLSIGTEAIPIATHYHNLYIQTILETVPQLEQQGEHGRIVSICRAALPMEPYNETLHQYLMRALIALEDREGAAAVYEKLRERLYHDFGITPAAQTRAIWREAANTVSDQSLPIETVLEHLLEPNPAAGAMQCDFDSFKIICHAEARAMLRSGNATHVALLSVTGERDKLLSKRSLDRAMGNLGEQIRLNLHRGDVFSKCSVSQYVIMLPDANYEDSCVACCRLIAAFYRRYPHSPTRIHFLVRPLPAQTLEDEC